MSAQPGIPAALDVRELDVAYAVRGRDRAVLRSLSFTIAAGESYGLVGESGCGKSTAAMAAVRYLPRNGHVRGGSISLAGEDLLAMSGEKLRQTRAGAVSMVYQDPSRALNPTIPVGRQVAEVYEIAGAGGDARELAEQMLARVQIADAGSVMRRYPHQLSGGMQQRVVIAMALASNPALLILDEPTTGLDATVEAEVLDLVAGLREELSSSVLFISHNLGVIARMCDRVGVLYAGTLIEEGPARTVFEDPRHPYTVGLLRCIPRGGQRKDHGRLDTIPGFLPAPGAELPGCVFADRCALADDRCRTERPPSFDLGGGRQSACYYHERAGSLPRDTPAELPPATPPDRGAVPVLRAEELTKTFHQQGTEIHALAGISAELWPGETLGLVGESGSGKTTLARLLLGITAPDEGGLLELDGSPLAATTGKRTADQVRAVQIVFQNPDSALNRRHTVRRIIGRALTKLAGLRGEAREQRLLELTRSVKLADRFLSARPSALSGGLKQRVAIARAFAGSPRVVVCDEPTSALDVSVQATILNLLADLQREQHVSYLFISHDLAVVRYLSDRIAVLYLGRLMELGLAETVFEAPHHPYTEALLSAVPTIEGGERERIKLAGEIPSAANPPSGCVFQTRCPRKLGEICETVEPPLAEAEDGHLMRCHIPLEELRVLQRGERVGA